MTALHDQWLRREPVSADLDATDPDRTDPDRTGPDRTGPDRTAPDVAALLASRADPDAFAVLFDRYFAELRLYAASRLGGELGDDVAAETFLVAFRTR